MSAARPPTASRERLKSSYLSRSERVAASPVVPPMTSAGADRLAVRDGRLQMDGPEIFNFALEVVPKALDAALAANGLAREAIDLFVFHQANRFMLETLGTVCRLPRERFYIDLETTGNTVSASLPIALRQLQDAGRLTSGMRVLLVGFGVGLSWGATVLTV